MAIIELATSFANIKPDVVLTIADRYETIATAIAASYLNIPVAHVQGEEVTGSIDEKVRHAVTKLADIHFVANENSQERVVRMGEDANNVYVTGCPSIDLAAEVLSDTKIIEFESEFPKGVGIAVDISKPFLMFMQHPVTVKWESAQEQMNKTLRAIKSTGIPALWFWPNVDAGSDSSSRAIRRF